MRRILLLLLLSACATGVAAQTFPSRAVRVVVAFPPGGSADVLARLIAPKLTDLWGQPVLVENKPGASANIGTDHVAKAAPDGYTLLLATSAFGVIPSLYGSLPFDAAADFVPVNFVATFASVLVAHPSVPANTVAELIAHAKAKPGVLNFASAGSGSTGRLAGELLKQSAGIDIVHIPYKGGAPAFADLTSGRVQIMFANVTEVVQPIRAGTLKGLAFTGRERIAVLPGVPTVAEAGYPGLEVINWQGVLAPAKTPDDIVRRLNAEIRSAVLAPEVRERFQALGLALAEGSPESLCAHIKAEIAKWGQVIRTGGIKPD